MNIFQKILTGNFGKQKGIVHAPFTSNVIQRFGTNSYGALSNKDYLSEFRNWVFACVTARAEEVGNIKLKLFKDGEEIFEHEVLDLINKVNPTMTKHQLFEATQGFKDLDGNAYWYLARDGANGDGKIQEIYLLKPDKVKIIIDKTNPLKVAGYLFTQPDGQVIPFAPENILHHKNFDPRAPYPFPHKGMGIVEASAFAIDTDNSARDWNLNFFKNSARPDGLLITDGEGAMDPEEFKRLKEEWQEEHGGAGNSHKLSILSGGLKYQELTRNQRDMDFVAQRTFSRDEILALFRVPKTIIGITDDVNRANADATVYVFALRTIKPLMQKIVDTLNEFLLPNWKDENLRFEFITPVTEDRTAKTAEYGAGHNVWLSTNDIRRAEGLLPTENGDKMYQSSSMIEFDTTPEPDIQKSVSKKSTKKAIKKEVKKSGSLAENVLDSFIAKMPLSNRQKNLDRKGLTKEEQNKHIESWKKRMANTNPLKRKVNDYFAKQEKEVQKNLREEMKGLESKEFKYKALGDILFDGEKAISMGISLITPFIQQYIRESGDAGNSSANGDGFNFNDKKVQDFIPKRAEYFAKTINETTSTDLLNSIQEGIDDGESLDEISARIADIYNKAQDFRTDMIARTEVAASSNFGAVQGYLQAGITEHQWIVVDPKDEDCLDNDGVITKIGDSFPSGDNEPPIHPNCQCTTVPIFGDE